MKITRIENNFLPGHFFENPPRRSPEALQTKINPGNADGWQPYLHTKVYLLLPLIFCSENVLVHTEFSTYLYLRV